MLTRIHLNNFKCFDALSLPLAPLTVLTGFNAAGKSTALQSLLLLAQSLRSGNRTAELPLNGSLVRLGTPGEAFNEHMHGKLMMLGVETEHVKTAWTLQAAGIAMRVNKVSIDTGDKQLEDNARDGLDMLLPAASPPAARQLMETLRETVFLSAVRAGTADLFPFPEGASPIHADVGIQGEFAPWWFDRYLEEDVEPARRHPSDSAMMTLHRQFNAWAGGLFPGAQANVQKVAKTNLMRLELRIGDTDDWRRPSNIGYGLTYAFPVLVAGLLAKPRQLLIIDSPEAHLHPMGQSRMGRFLAQVAAAGVQIIVETHSDHILNGVRLALHDKLITPDRVAVHFFNYSGAPQSGASAQVVSPAVDTQGNLSEWPEGFFDQSEKDLARLAGWE
ncbi:MAG: DUF3696 domain-containing protein [Gammaproteobacteria bacterium]|nr:DUF3696 domain-containing protein [Gammaproteobacteria bacterium]